MINLNQNLRFLLSQKPVDDSKSYFTEISQLALRVDQDYPLLTKMGEVLFWRSADSSYLAGFLVVGHVELSPLDFYLDTSKNELTGWDIASRSDGSWFDSAFNVIGKVNIEASSQESLEFSQIMKFEKESH